MARSSSNYRITFTVLAIGVGAFALLQSMIIPVLAVVQVSLHTTQNTVTWVLTAYLLSASIATPIVGRIGDMIGKERMFVLALVTLAAGSVLAAVATSVGVLIVARVIQGIGGGVMPLGFGIIRDEFPPLKVSGAIGSLAALTAAGAGLGIAISGPIVSVLSYHWLFWIPAIMTSLAAIGAFFFVPASPVRTSGKVNWWGAVLLAGWLVALLLALSQAPSWGWGSPKVLGLLAVAVALLPLWILVESRSHHPLIDMKMMRIPTVFAANVVALLMGSGMYATFAFIPQFMETSTSTGYGLGTSVTLTGVLLIPQALASFVLGVASGVLNRAFGARRVLIGSLLIAMVGFFMLAFFHASIWEVVLATVIQGTGFGAAYAAMSGLVVEAVPAAQTGVASGMNANIRTIGGSIGTAVVSSLITAKLAADGIPVESGYRNGFAVVGVVTLVAVGACFIIPKAVAGRAARQPDYPHAELGVVAGGTLAGAEPE